MRRESEVVAGFPLMTPISLFWRTGRIGPDPSLDRPGKSMIEIHMRIYASHGRSKG